VTDPGVPTGLRLLAEGRLDHCENVAWDPFAGCAVAGGEDGQLYRIGLDGSVEEACRVPGAFLLGVAVDADGAVIACDVRQGRIHRIDPSGSSEVLGPELPAPNYPALAADGTLYVSLEGCDFGSGVATGPVKRFDASGAYVGEVIGSGSSGLAGPTGLAIRDSTLYTASIMSGAVLQTALPGDTTLPFGSTGVAFGASPLALLSDGGILAGSAGGAGAIYRFDSAGNLGLTFDSGLGTIGGIAVAPVPEPSAALLAVLGVAGVAAGMRRRRTACPR